MKSLLCACFVLNLVFPAVSGQSAPAEDLIVDLPGLPYPAPFQQYSGYLKVSEQKYLHYWLVESENDPENDPIVVWYNGGPGCSSLGGFFTENGPFRVGEDGKSLIYNNYAWNKNANVFFVEAPAGVGFSYAKDGDTKTDDELTAQDNYHALKDFFKKFPRYRNRDFYITGESYAGVYIPTVASKVIDDPSFNLKGYAIGNGLLDRDMNDNSIVLFAYFHGMVGDQAWARIIRYCCDFKLLGCNFMASENPLCAKEINAINALVEGGELDYYNLYKPCVGGVQNKRLSYDNNSDKFVSTYFGYPFGRLPVNQKHMNILKRLPNGMVKKSLPCQNDTAVRMYLDSPDVRRAIHVDGTKQPAWEDCRNLDYTKIYFDMRNYVLKAVNAGLRILIYNGDVDMACNFLGDEWFVDSLDLPGAKSRRAWYFIDENNSKQVGGWTKHYQLLDFVTVKGSGHFVPTDKPIAALKMFNAFLKNQSY